ncbi:hypothetical protein D3C81_966060 [compost metagenome]
MDHIDGYVLLVVRQAASIVGADSDPTAALNELFILLWIGQLGNRKRAKRLEVELLVQAVPHHQVVACEALPREVFRHGLEVRIDAL